MAWNETQHCRLLARLVPEHLLQLCRRHLEALPSVVQAAEQTKRACQQTFADTRWNCSSVEAAPNFTPELQKSKGEATDKGNANACMCLRVGLAVGQGAKGRVWVSLGSCCRVLGRHQLSLLPFHKSTTLKVEIQKNHGSCSFECLP